MHIKVFADSACDLDLDYLKELDVEMIPMTVSFGDEVYEDRVTITTKEFYEKLKNTKELPKTSQIPPSKFVERFKPYIDKGYHIVYIAFSSRLSGTYQSACIAKDMLETENITVIDSKGASVGLGLIVREAALMVKQGRTLNEVIERIIYMKDRMEHIFAVGNLDMLKRGGRISTAQAAIGTLLNVKPILQFSDGYIIPYDKVRGEKGIIKKIIETMKERGYELENQVIGMNYSNNLDFCLKLKEEIQKEFNIKEFVISEIGAAIGSHVGEGTTSVFFLRK
ncbi:DegV family protein [Thermobrachium celere]|uniref:DegV family protein n=1 Tax=Thermobrachium celere DSM 8682 TaxID=941824 RepID=R7RSW8_9CLOT|nr:DegV family protein [Thermobrachium celere]GFR35206.1 DegV domain-containing protein YitS [Thermobrachium celere]CDF58350.1 degV family protein [Thermobrachium celere DSM 8682]